MSENWQTRHDKMIQDFKDINRKIENAFWQQGNLVSYDCILCSDLTMGTPETEVECKHCGGPTKRSN